MDENRDDGHGGEIVVTVSGAGDGQDVVIAGTLDATTAADLRGLLWTLIETATGDLRLHLGDAVIGDSTGLGLLAHTHTYARRHDRHVLLVETSPRTDRLLRATRLSLVLSRRLARDSGRPAGRHTGSRRTPQPAVDDEPPPHLPARSQQARGRLRTVATLTG